MCDRGLRALWQQYPDPVARPHSHRRERISAAVRQTLQVVKGKALDLAVGCLINQRKSAAAVGMPVTGGDTDIESLRQCPTKAAVNRVVVLAALKHEAFSPFLSRRRSSRPR